MKKEQKMQVIEKEKDFVRYCYYRLGLSLKDYNKKIAFLSKLALDI